jgi:hypothetical protein
MRQINIEKCAVDQKIGEEILGRTNRLLSFDSRRGACKTKKLGGLHRRSDTLRAR